MSEPAANDTGVLVNPIPVNPRARFLVLGGGYTGHRFASALQTRGLTVQLTHRDTTPTGATIPALLFDSEAGHRPTSRDLADTTHVLVTIPPTAKGDDPVLLHLAETLSELPLEWIGYLSTTGVYGDHQGGWVNETTITRPRLMRSHHRLRCEEAWRRSGLPVQILRLPAIYGPFRSPFAGLRSGRAKLIHKPGQVFSRIHVDDIVGALLHLLAIPCSSRPDTVNLSDDAPCPSSESLGYAAHLLDCPLPAVESFTHIAAEMSAMARSFWSENRRVDNHLLCRTLGYRLRYPSYLEGYRACLAEERSVAAPAL